MKKTFQLCVCFYNIYEGKTDGWSYKTMFMFNLVSGVPVPKELFIWWSLEKWSSLHWCRNAATVPIWIARIIFTNNLWVLDRINKTDRGWTAVDTARIPGENPHASTCFLFVIFYLIFLWLQTTSITSTHLQWVSSDGAGEAEWVALSQNARGRNNFHWGCNCGETKTEACR